MRTEIVYPQNDLLKKYIKYFLFIQNDQADYSKSHISYPNTNHCLGLYKGSRLIPISEREYSVEESSDYHSYLTGIYRRPINFQVNGLLDEICIDFEPMGIEALSGYQASNSTFINSVIENVFPKSWYDIYRAAFSSNESKQWPYNSAAGTVPTYFK